MFLGRQVDMVQSVRIGIDVGGTFTHAVALDGLSLAILGKVKVPTTHQAPEGVAKGIIQSLLELLSQTRIAPDDVGFIAHSTTQATNALLEGDVAPVGILGMGAGANAWLARLATNIGHIKLAPGKLLTTYHRFIDTTTTPSDSAIQEALGELITRGAKAIAISESFSVDSPDTETRALSIAHQMGLPATAGSAVSQLYGLKVRTRTAVINASMLPKMIEAADMTEHSVREAGIQAPIMIMRSDGGVMDIDAMRKRPIMTMLSGPAAGVAAAMMYLHISDGIFMEVGGTSTDISAIRNGKALVKSAEVGGHRVYMRTLDVRTLGIAGGSMLRVHNGALVDVGPRSAHIAGLKYASFSEPLANPCVRFLKPCPADPSDYTALSDGEGQAIECLTTTCAANLLHLVPDDDCALGNQDAIKTAFDVLGNLLHISPEKLAEHILQLSAAKVIPVVQRLLADYKLDPQIVTLVGGGGGAAALTPFTAQEMNLRHSLAQNADVISAIGVALALVRETVERQIIHPDADDILRIRQEAHSQVQKMGADPSTIEIHVEIDSRTNVVRATASGATAFATGVQAKQELSLQERQQLVANSMRVSIEEITLAAQTACFQVFGATTIAKRLGGLVKFKCHSLRTVDASGIIRLQTQNGIVRLTTVNQAEKTIADLAEEHSQYGDAGRIIPPIMLLVGPKLVDLSGLLDITQVIALAKIELESIPQDDKIIVIANLP
ncbi:MAG: hypothetical protein HY711_11635, partial [Candidatus Melainabacteria bacterium]|nr:hypothetical protein [Candidatus Melainabacteria bacterium]